MYLIPPRSNLHHECASAVEILWFHAILQRADGIDLFELLDCVYEQQPDHPERTAEAEAGDVRDSNDPHPSARITAPPRP